MWILHIGLGYFKVILHVGIVFKARSSLKGIQTIYMGFFEAWVLHLGLILHLYLQYRTYIYLYQLAFWGFVAIPTPIITFTNWNFGASLQYLNPYLPLPTWILGLHCNTYTHTYLYQLEFWGLIAILALILTSSN